MPLVPLPVPIGSLEGKQRQPLAKASYIGICLRYNVHARRTEKTGLRPYHVHLNFKAYHTRAASVHYGIVAVTSSREEAEPIKLSKLQGQFKQTGSQVTLLSLVEGGREQHWQKYNKS